jgi:hypothetical protein
MGDSTTTTSNPITDRSDTQSNTSIILVIFQQIPRSNIFIHHYIPQVIVVVRYHLNHLSLVFSVQLHSNNRMLLLHHHHRLLKEITSISMSEEQCNSKVT